MVVPSSVLLVKPSRILPIQNKSQPRPVEIRLELAPVKAG
jgi:hypothetical protein